MTFPPGLRDQDIEADDLLDLLREHAYRVLYVAEGFRKGLSVEQVFEATKIDPGSCAKSMSWW